MQKSEYFTQESSLDINYLSHFVQYPHYQIACCLRRWSTTVTAKALTSQQKEKPHGKKKDLRQTE